MDRLWAPWRLSYVRAAGSNDSKPSDKPAPNRDFILFGDQHTDDRENLVIDRSRLSIVILNRYPYNNGHLLVAPRRAVETLNQMTEEELLDNQLQIRRMIAALTTFLKPDGFNVGLNLGKAAGAGLPEHLHWHIVPRWVGDTNYMTLTADLRVIVQSLDELWLQLRTALGLPVE